MLNILSSKATSTNGKFAESKRKKREDNLQWLKRNFKPTNGRTPLLLLGGTDPCAFRLRVAQSHLRHDLTPSHWSHVSLLFAKDSLASAELFEISLDPERGFGFPPSQNSVQTAKINRYRDAKRFPNIALVYVPVEMGKVLAALTEFKKQRVLDATELVVLWLAFAWGVGRTANPLLDGRGIPSAAMLEIVTAAAGYDLTPGLESRSSCPEAIWQAARWWHHYYSQEKREVLSGAWNAEHFFVSS